MKKYILFLIIIIILPLNLAANYPLKITKVIVEGNKSISANEIKSDLPIQGVSIIKRIKKIIPFIEKEQDPLYYEVDFINSLKYIVNLYQKNGFLQAQVSYKISYNKDKAFVNFYIEENNRIIIDSISINNEKSTEIHDILEKKTSKWINSNFTDNEFYHIKNQIEKECLENSYLMQKVSYTLDVNADTTKVHISFNIKEGEQYQIQKIDVKGLDHIAEKTVKGQLPVHQNTMYKPSLTDYYFNQINQLNHFKSISVDTDPIDGSSNEAAITIKVHEKSKHQFRSGIGYGLEDKVRAFIEYNQYNFLGNARQLQISIKSSALEPWNINLKTREPLPLRHSLYGTINPFWMKQKENIYEIERLGYILGLTQHINVANTYQILYLFEHDHLYTAEVFETDELLPYYNKSSVYLSWFSNYLKTNKGISNNISLLRSGIGFNSQYHFFRLLNNTQIYYSLTSRNTLAFQAKYGSITSFDNDKIIPIEERFFAGGANSIRGWSRNEISPINENDEKTGGNKLFELSLENRYLLLKDLEFALFLDVGNVWSKKEDFSDLLKSAGFGMRYYTILGPIRLDFARPVNIDKWQFYLQIGQSF
ncbi:MAG TPA: BamA/TamA family outer membrane protein [Candidatus Cloacimonadota bacterium]|nr:BamA/TamA family outer membrane protein [Candidatus Cloacimonadota bacterium]HQB41149.1 BamA/TamA family outer membrane protein [Candidatus Cloacimonadota bacterium]